MADNSQYNKLPAGWDCKIDQATGNFYYINYFTKVMTLDDPRNRYKQLQNERCSSESIPMQPLHGSPYHVYPSNNFPAVKAFQMPANTSLQNISASPLLPIKTQNEVSPISLQTSLTPQTSRMMANMSRRSTIQETSFSSNQIETDTVVTKIQNMFPTASENHIRLLLKKYMKTIFPKADETLLLDILANSDNNVQKASEKLISLGYVKRDFAAPPKLNNRQNENVEKKSDDEKIIPLRPKDYTQEEKEQMKIRLKEKYKNIAERIISMALESVNFSEDRAIQILQIVKEEDETHAKKSMEITGQIQLVEESLSKIDLEKESINTKTTIEVVDAATDNVTETSIENNEIPLFSITNTTTTSTSNNIKSLRSSLLSQPSKSFSLPSSNSKNNESSSSFQQITTKSILQRASFHDTSTSNNIHFISRSRDKSGSLKNSPPAEEEQDVIKCSEFKSILNRISVMGHNAEIAQGPDDSLLLADYVTWNGANPDISVGHKQQIALGPDPTNLSERSYISHGRNPDLCKGAKVGLAKGSIYLQLKANIKCN